MASSYHVTSRATGLLGSESEAQCKLMFLPTSTMDGGAFDHAANGHDSFNN